MDRIKSRTYTYWLAIPGLLLFSVFFLVPAFFGVLLSLTNTIGIDFSKFSFAGLSNYALIFEEPELRVAVFNTFLFAFITTVCKVGFALFLAVILNMKIRGRDALRTIFFLPAVLNSVAVGLIFISMMHPQTGFINRTLRLLGLGFLAKDWLADPHLAIFSVASIEIWRWTGFCMVILLTGLQSIPQDVYEAGDIDGASPWQRFRYITFPLVLPAFNNAFILSLVGGLKVFDLVQCTTQGGPGYATQVFGTLVFSSFSQGRFGEGCAESIALSIVVAIFAIPSYLGIQKKEVET